MPKTQSQFDILFGPLNNYGVAGLKPSQAKMYAGQPKRIYRSALELQAAERMAGKEPSDLGEIFGRPMRQVGHGLMSVLEYMDRPQDTVFSVVDSVLDGETDWSKIWRRAKANITGEADTEFAEILDHLPNNMRQSMAEAAVPVLFHGKKAFKDITHAVGLGKGSTGMVEPSPTWENARNIYGIAGDIVVDPWNLVGAGALKLRQMAKIARAAGHWDTAAKMKLAAGVAMDPIQTGIEGFAAGARAAGRLALKNDNIENFARSTFLRGTGNKPIDDLIHVTGSERGLVMTDIRTNAEEMMKSIAPLAKKYERGGKLYPLIEERIFKPLVKDADGKFSLIPPTARQAFTKSQAEKLLDTIEGIQKGSNQATLDLIVNSDTFSNPKNVKWWVQNYDPTEREAVVKAMTDMRTVFDTRIAMRQAQGMKVPELYDQQIKSHNAARRAMEMSEKEAAREMRIETAAKIKAARKIIKGKEQVARQLVGPKVFKEVMTDYKASPDINLLKKGYKDAIRRRLATLLGNIESKDVSALEKYEQLVKAGHLTDMGEAELAKTLKQNLSYQKLVQVTEELGRGIENGPAYVAHIATAEVARELAKNTPEAAGLRNQLSDPNIINDMTRKYVDNHGIALSMEQVDDILEKSGVTGITTHPKINVPEDIEKIETKVVYKDEHLGKKIKRVFGKGDERDLAHFWETDPAAIYAITGQRTAKSITASQFVKGLMDLKFIRPDLSNLPEEQARTWVSINQFKSLNQMVKRYPELAGYYVQKPIATDISRVADTYFGQMVSHPLVRAYDLSKKWGISYMLPLYPATWNRNELGMLLAQMYGGMWSNPLKFGQDAYQMLRGKTGQLHMMRGNLKEASKIKVNIKSLGARNETPLPEVVKLALKYGVANADYYGSEVRDLLSLKKWHENWKAFVPGSTDFGLVKGGRQVMRWSDEGNRMVLFIHYLEDGYTPAQSAALTKKYAGNFLQETLTPFERKIMTRVFPFYRWARYNVPLTVDQLLFSPSTRYRLTGLRRIHEELLEPESESGGRVRAWTPSFLQEVGGVPVDFDKKTGEMKFMALEGYIPAADIGNWLGGYDVAKWVLSQLTPPLQAGIEIGTRKSVFGGQDFEGKREMFGQEFPTLIVHLMRKLRFLSELDRFDPLGTFHKQRKLSPMEERLAKALAGAGIYRTKPMKHIVEFNENMIEDLRKQTGYLRSPSYRQNLDDWHDRTTKISKALRLAEDYDDKMRAANGHPPVDTTTIEQMPKEKLRNLWW